MRFGKLKVKFNGHELKEASINARLDAVYGKMFKSAKAKVKRWPNKMENGIQVGVVGRSSGLTRSLESSGGW